jgi:prepilin-type N-terminal cleavage/methylation domain-containing protein
MQRNPKRAKRQSGFTMIEAMISIVILSFGILSLASVYAQGIFLANVTQYDYIAEKKAEQAMESIFSARDSAALTWANIQNTGNGPGVFLVPPQPLVAPGPDGLYGTADDDAATPDVVIIGPGPDGLLNTKDDVVMPLTNMTRTITITDVPNETALRQVTITMNYTVGRLQRQYTLISYISAFT